MMVVNRLEVYASHATPCADVYDVIVMFSVCRYKALISMSWHDARA